MPTGEPPIRWKTVCSHTYSTQGFGAIKYAKQSAESAADKARMHGLNPDIRMVNETSAKGPHGVAGADFEIWVDTTKEGLVLLEYKPDLTLREWVKACWGRQVNPRVYNPMLPYVYEEKEGLDCFGHEKGEPGYIPPH